MGSISSFLAGRVRRTGLLLCAAGAGTLAWGAVATPAVVTIESRLVSSGPPCGAGELCIKQTQVPTTAQAFSGGSCGDLVSAHPDMDLWHFVIPSGASFSSDTADFTAIFTSPDGSIHADSIGGPSDEFAFVYSPAGATLTWAFATNVTGEAVQDYFVLSGTCAASQQSSSTTSTSTTTTTSTTTSSTPTGSVSGSSTTSDGSSTGSVQGVHITTPNTGAGEGGYMVLAGLMLLGAGSALVGLAGKRRS